MKVVGIVLAGGKSRRFGEPKAFAVYNGKFFYEQVCEALKPHVGEIVIVAHPELRTRFTSFYRIIEDDPVLQGRGPLAGLYSVMKTVQSDWYCVLACDMPLINEEIVERLIKAAESNTYDAIVPKIDGQLQPLAAMYHRKTFATLESLLNDDERKVKRFLDRIQVRYLQENDFMVDSFDYFQNINTKEEYARLKGEAGQ
jgi:molybdopterin-guanine dinucleotide biosynthesis protein A